MAPLAVTEATEHVVGWLTQPNATIVVPTSRRWPLLRSLLDGPNVSENLTTDTHIAALAIEHGFTVFSNDTDFARFDNLGWENR